MTKTFDTLASQESLDKTVQSLQTNGFLVDVVEGKTEALEKIKSLIPSGVSVHNGASVTLEQVGFIDYLKSETHGWNNLHAAIVAETDEEKKEELRKGALFSEYYLGSVHSLSETGEIVIASNTGSQLPHLVYTSQNAILVVSTKKITSTLAEAMQRLEEYVIPLEDERLMGVYNAHTTHTKTVILHKVNPNLGKTVRVVFVKEELGF